MESDDIVDLEVKDEYDIVLHRGCRTEPELNDLAERIPELRDPTLHPRLMQWRHEWPDFLGLDVPQALVRTLLERLRNAGASARTVLSAYRQPRIPRSEARLIAEADIARRYAQYPNYDFKPVEFRREEPETWWFWAISEGMRSEGHIPGALTAAVDKLDGHIWQPGESERRFSGT